MKGNYDNVAPFYDLLSQLVYGDAMLQAQKFLINAVPTGSHVLIIGGGTGQILEEISKKHTGGLQITYVDISKKMIASAKEKDTGNNKVSFINQSIVDISFAPVFDVVITAFFFDNFATATATFIFNKIHTFLRPGGLWLFSDFQRSKKNNLWQKLLLKLMYIFFRFFCGIEASHLPDTAALFQKNNYQPVAKKTFYGKFIYSVIYLKRGI